MKQKSDFRRLHEQEGCFLIPNPWDVGTARCLASLGYLALATTSAGLAFALDQCAGQVSQKATLAHCRDLVAVPPLPVSADLEKGFGDSPQSCAQTIQAAAATGLVGGSIEDHTGEKSDPIYSFDLAVARIGAACAARDALKTDFVLTARCENFLWGRLDLRDTIRRLQAFEAAGADVLYAPGLHDLETIKTVCRNVTKPVNVVMGMPGAVFDLTQLAEAGVKRVSVGSALARLALARLALVAFVTGAREMIEDGSFHFGDRALGFAELETYFAP